MDVNIDSVNTNRIFGCEHRPVNFSESWKWFVVLCLRSDPCTTPQVSGSAPPVTPAASLCTEYTNVYIKKGSVNMPFLQILNI